MDKIENYAHGSRNTLLMALPSQLLCCTSAGISYELNLSVLHNHVSDRFRCTTVQLLTFLTSVAIFKDAPFSYTYLLCEKHKYLHMDGMSIHTLRIYDSRATKFSAIQLPKRVCETPQEPTNFYKPSFGDLTLFSWRHCISGVIFLSRALRMNCKSATIGVGII